MEFYDKRRNISQLLRSVCDAGATTWNSVDWRLWPIKKKSRIRVKLGPLVRVCLGLTILCHESKVLPLVLSIPWVHVYTISPCLYHESMSLPWVHVYTMSPCLYIESMSIPWVHVYTMSSCLYHESMSIPWVNVYTRILCLYHEYMSIPRVLANNKSHCPNYEARHLNYRNTKK